MQSHEHNIIRDEQRAASHKDAAQRYSRNVATILSKLDYSKPEIALGVAGDEAYHSSYQGIIDALKGSKHVVLIGIGGSSLCVEAIYEALAMKTSPKLYVLDAIEPDALFGLEAALEGISDMNSLAVFVISKSGHTVETVTNATLFIEKCEQKFGNEVRKRIAFIGSEGSEFLQLGEREGVMTARVPEAIGGRYSVFSAVGMLPLAVLGFDLHALREGVTEALTKARRDATALNSVTLATLAEAGTHTLVFFTFNERLRLLGFWYRQLIAESIGKEMTTDGTTFSHQLLPTVATSVDLHSMAQLYLSGYKGMFTHFIYGDTQSDHHVLADHWMLEYMPHLKGKTSRKIKDALREGTLKAYDDQKIPYRITLLPKITAHELGLLMASLMFETMCLGALLHVNVFNQPSVEAYKAHSRKLLGS